jgi:ribokinase
MISVFGSVNLDLIGKVDRIPRPGETVPGHEFATAPGGKGANQALAAARAGAKVRMIGAAGKDAMGNEALALLAAGGVDLSEVRRLDLPQGVAMIFVDAHGENVIGILPGANAAMSAADADRTLANLGKDDVLVVQQEIGQEATLRALALARQHGARAILNTAPAADIVVSNETEFELMSGEPPTDAALLRWARAHNQTIIATLGPDGARAATPDGTFAVPSIAITPVDTVGAGDTFVGYLAAGLEQGRPLADAMRRAAVAAGLACLKPGAQPSIPTAAEVDARLG